MKDLYTRIEEMKERVPQLPIEQRLVGENVLKYVDQSTYIGECKTAELLLYLFEEVLKLQEKEGK